MQGSFRSRLLAFTTVMAIASGILIIPPVADVASAEEVSGAWTGRINVTFSYSLNGRDRMGVETGFFSDLAGIPASSQGTFNHFNYTAYAAVTFSQTTEFPDPQTAGGICRTEQSWFFTGPSTTPAVGNTNFWRGSSGYAFELYDLSDGTYFYPKMVGFTSDMDIFCPSGNTTVEWNNAALSYSAGGTPSPEEPLADDDPDPNHLVGTTVLGLNNIPGGNGLGYTSYEYTITYDLQRNLAVTDSDLDGIPDDTDYCPTTSGSALVWGCPAFEVDVQYAYTGNVFGFNGGDMVRIRPVNPGDDLSWLGQVCIIETWTATLKNPQSSVSMLWNGDPAVDLPNLYGDIERTKPTKVIGPLKLEKFPDGIFNETIRLLTCGPIAETRAASITEIATLRGQVIGLSHSTRVFVTRNDAGSPPEDFAFAQVTLDPSKADKKLTVFWFEQKTVQFG